MTELEQIVALKARLKEWEDAALEVVARHISFENSIEMLTAENTELKAQVNCLRDALTRLTLAYGDAEYNSSFLVLSSTPEQCLAEVKAKAIIELKETSGFDCYGWTKNEQWAIDHPDITSYFDSLDEYLDWYANQLRKQAK